MFYLKWSNLYRRFESDAHGFVMIWTAIYCKSCILKKLS